MTRERQSYSLATDYKFNPNHKISFKGIYNRRSDWENRYRITYKKLNEDPSKQSVVLQTKGGSGDNKDARLELQQTMDFMLDGEHTFGRLNMDWAGSFSRATEDRPNERYFGVTMKGKKMKIILAISVLLEPEDVTHILIKALEMLMTTNGVLMN